MYNDLSDFISRTKVVETTEGDKVILVDWADSNPITLIGFVADFRLDDFEVQELGWKYYQQLQVEINKI